MDKKITYEQAIEKLQVIVERLETGEDSLEDSIKLFEEGAKLSAFCYDKLNKAEQKINTIARKEIASDEE